MTKVSHDDGDFEMNDKKGKSEKSLESINNEKLLVSFKPLNIFWQILNIPLLILWVLYVLMSLKSFIIFCVLIYKGHITLFRKILFDDYKDKDFDKEEDNPIAVETLETYLHFMNNVEDFFNTILRTVVNSTVTNSTVARTMLVKEHLLQEQVEDHNGTTEATIRIKTNPNPKGKLRVRLNEGNLFGLVIKNHDKKMLSDLLRDARKLNEEIYKIFLEKEGQDFYGKFIPIDDTIKPFPLFFSSNQDFLKSVKDRVEFETNKTIYCELKNFISGWLVESANVGDSEPIHLYFNLTDTKKILTFEDLFLSLNNHFFKIIDRSLESVSKEVYQSNKRRRDQKITDELSGKTESQSKDYKKLLEQFHDEAREVQKVVDTFYLDEIKQFILTIVTRTQPDKPVSILDQIVNHINAFNEPKNILEVGYHEYIQYKPSGKSIPCSFVFEEIKKKCFDLDNAPWTKYEIFSKENMSPEVWEDIKQKIEERRDPSNKSPRGPRKSFYSHFTVTDHKEDSGHNQNEDESPQKDDDSDISWLRGLLEESRKTKWEEGQEKHFSEFTIDKGIIIIIIIIISNHQSLSSSIVTIIIIEFSFNS